MLLLVRCVLVCIVCFISIQPSLILAQQTNNNKENDDVVLLLKLAREYRYGSKNNDINLQRAAHFYQYVVERSQKTLSHMQTEGKNNDDNDEYNKILSTALFELSEVFEDSPTIANLHSNNFIQINTLLNYTSVQDHEQPSATPLQVPLTSWDLLVFSADLGNEHAQYKLSQSLSTGIYQDQLVPMQASRAVLLANLAALSGNQIHAMMHMGYRYFSGFNVKSNCEKSLLYYEYVANQAIEYLIAEDLLNTSPERLRVHEISNDASSSSQNGGSSGGSARVEITEEIVDYYTHLIENHQDPAAAYFLGTIYLSGNRYVPRDINKAIYYLSQAAIQEHLHATGLLAYTLVKQLYHMLIHSIHNKYDTNNDFNYNTYFAYQPSVNYTNIAVDHLKISLSRTTSQVVTVESSTHGGYMEIPTSLLDYYLNKLKTNFDTIRTASSSSGASAGATTSGSAVPQGQSQSSAKTTKSILEQLKKRVTSHTTTSTTTNYHDYDSKNNGENVQLLLDTIEGLLLFASKRSEQHGVLGLGVWLLYSLNNQPSSHLLINQYMNLNLPINNNNAESNVYYNLYEQAGLELLNKAMLTHSDAGMYMGEYLFHKNAFLQSNPFANKYTENSYVYSSSATNKHQQVKVFDISNAVQAYSTSAQLGNALSQHRMAHITSHGTISNKQAHLQQQQQQQQHYHVPRNCDSSVQMFKLVAERGAMVFDLFATANTYYLQKQYTKALKYYLELAYLGIEVAQYNAAYILSQKIQTTSSVNVGVGSYHVAMNVSSSTDTDASSSTGGDDSTVLYNITVLTGQSQSQGQSDGQGSFFNQFTHRLCSLFIGPSSSASRHNKETTNSAMTHNTLTLHPYYFKLPSYYHNHLTSFNGTISKKIAIIPAESWQLAYLKLVSSTSSSPRQLTVHVEEVITAELDIRALMFFSISAAFQHNPDALLLIGDYYYYGIAQRHPRKNKVLSVANIVDSTVNTNNGSSGSSNSASSSSRNKKQAAMFYQRAADLKHTHALFNLALMHEMGDGVQQDLHLAKRYYDQAAEIDPRAKVPRDIAIFLLEGHKSLQLIFGGDPFTDFQTICHRLFPSNDGQQDVCGYFFIASDVIKSYIVYLDSVLRGSIDSLVHTLHSFSTTKDQSQGQSQSSKATGSTNAKVLDKRTTKRLPIRTATTTNKQYSSSSTTTSSRSIFTFSAIYMQYLQIQEILLKYIQYIQQSIMEVYSILTHFHNKISKDPDYHTFQWLLTAWVTIIILRALWRARNRNNDNNNINN